MPFSLECAGCGSGENVKRFHFFATGEPDVEPRLLCWECRRPFVLARTRKPEAAVEPERGQRSLTDF